MSKISINTLFAISASAFINLFSVGTAQAVETVACDDGVPVWLESRTAESVDPAGETVVVHVPADGYLLAESYALDGYGEPQVIIDGAPDIGADWLSGRLLPVQAGTYCIRVAAQSSRKPLGNTRLALAFAERSLGGPLKNGEEEEPISEDPATDVLSRTGALATYSSLIPFDTAPVSTNKNGEEEEPISEDPATDVLATFGGFGGSQGIQKNGEEEEPISEDPATDVLVTFGGFDPTIGLQAQGLRKNGEEEEPISEDPATDVLATFGGFGSGTGLEKNGEEEEPISEDPATDVLVRGDVVAEADPASLAAQLGLCEGFAGDWGSLACSKQLRLNEPVVAQGDAAVSTYTFTLRRRASLALMAEGSMSLLALYDQSGRLIAAGDEIWESEQALSAGRYMLRVAGDGYEGHAFAMAEVGR